MFDPVDFNCPRCHQPIRAALQQAGGEVHCPRCNAAVTVPVVIRQAGSPHPRPPAPPPTIAPPQAAGVVALRTTNRLLVILIVLIAAPVVLTMLAFGGCILIAIAPSARPVNATCIVCGEHFYVDEKYKGNTSQWIAEVACPRCGQRTPPGLLYDDGVNGKMTPAEKQKDIADFLNPNAQGVPPPAQRAPDSPQVESVGPLLDGSLRDWLMNQGSCEDCRARTPPLPVPVPPPLAAPGEESSIAAEHEDRRIRDELEQAEANRVDDLIKRLTSAAASTERATAVQQLGMASSATRARAIGAIAGALDDVSPEVRHAAFHALQSFGLSARAAVPDLIRSFRAAKKGDAATRSNVLETLASVNGDDPEGVELLMEVARGASSGKARLMSVHYTAAERTTAIGALGSIGPDAERAAPLLLEILKLSARDMDRFAATFEETAGALAKIGVTGKGVTSTLKQFRAGKGIVAATPALIERAVVIADTALKTLAQGTDDE